MKKNIELSSLLDNVFSYKPKEIEPVIDYTPPIPGPQPTIEPTPEPVKRSSDNLNLITNVQSMVWGFGAPAPTSPNIKAPNVKMVEKGVAPTMANTSGWGKV